MRNLKLTAKMVIGFGTLIFFSLALGGLAAWEMIEVKRQTTVLAKAHVPEVGVANTIERHVFEAMHEMRGYAFTQDGKHLDESRKSIGEVKKALKEADSLSGSFPELEGLKGAIGTARAKLEEYEKLADETVSRNEAIAQARKKLDEAAEKYVDNCAGYLESQNKALTTDINSEAKASALLDHQKRISLVHEIIDLGDDTRIHAFKAQALRDTSILKEALENFAGMEQKLKVLKSMTGDESLIKGLDDTLAAADAYRDAMKELLSNQVSLEEISMKRHMAAEGVMEAARGVANTGMSQMTSIANEAARCLSDASAIVLVGLGAAALLSIVVAAIVTVTTTRPIKSVIEGLSDAAEQVAAASSQVASASQHLAEGASEQAASIEETSSSLEEMTSMTRQNAENSGEANRLMAEANHIVSQAGESMSRLTVSMGEISRASEETQKIIRTIDEIAFQTNLLALNAAVEAARAGEAGAGFAVVADEVRNLALRAAEAAKNTAGMIESTVSKIREGVELVESTEKDFSEVARSVTKSGELMAEISVASREQAQGIDQVNQAVSEMDKVTQQNAANAEQSASASEEMSAQALQMGEFVSQLAALVGGATGGHGEGETRGRGEGKIRRDRERTVLLHVSASTPRRTTVQGAPSSRQLPPVDRNRRRKLTVSTVG